MDKKASLKRLLTPETIAVFGGAPAEQVIRQCRKVGFGGTIWPVHPRRESIEGIDCFENVDALPGAPDASFIGVGPDTTIELVTALATRGAGGAVCYAAGFAEADDAGRSRQERLLETAGDMALVGPNCHGFINYLDGVALWPDEHGGRRCDKGVAFVLQSGNIGISISMNQRSLPISYLITVGNKADADIHDYIDALLDDGRVTAIGLYIEGLDDVAAFSQVALKALQRQVPIAALKSGSSELGAQAAMSHTSSLAGSNEFYDALFDRVGVARCETLEELLETLKFLSVVGALPGNNIASMSCSGGEASLVADQSEKLGLALPQLSETAHEELNAVLGDKVHIANPLDYHTYIWGDYDALYRCFSAVLRDSADCSILVIDYPREDVSDGAAWATTERALIDAVEKTGQRAVIVSSLFENVPQAVRDRLLASGIAPMQGLRECLLAIHSAAGIGARVARLDDINAIPELIDAEGGPRTLDEWQSKTALAEFGLSVPDGRLCESADVAAAAEAVGYPVCLKIVSDTITHKTDIGGVRIGLRDRQELATALLEMESLSEQFLVEAMAERPVAELIVGIKRDPQFGLALVIGAGGILVELLEDAATLLLPVSRDDIAEALSGLRIMRLVEGYRGQAAGDINALIDAINAIARYADENRHRLLELDVNPLLVMPDKAVAVDALIVVIE